MTRFCVFSFKSFLFLNGHESKAAGVHVKVDLLQLTSLFVEPYPVNMGVRESQRMS